MTRLKRVGALAGLTLALAACASTPLDGASADFVLPCDVDSVLKGVCQNCHSAPPKNGAPFPLVTGADTRRPYSALPSYDHTPVWQVMGDAVAADVMPPPESGVLLAAAQKAVLLDWVDAGAPEGDGGVCPEP